MSKELSTSNEINFTLPLRRFIERYLIREPNIDGARSMTLDTLDAMVIQALDKNETMCHIQYEDFDGTKLDNPRIWWINAWKKHYFVEMEKKRISAENRKEACLLNENTTRLMRKMAQDTGIDDPEIYRRIAYKIAKRKSDKAAAAFNVIIDKG